MEPLPDFTTTRRLVLRTWDAEDADPLGIAISTSLEHLRPWMPWAEFEPLPIEDRRKLFAEWEKEWQSGSDVIFGVFLDGTPIGGCGLHRRRGADALEIGYWIHVDHTRQGYATEISAALTDLAFTVDGIIRVEIHHDRANVSSEGVPRALGYELVAETADEITAPAEAGVDCTWVMTRDRWALRRSPAESEPAGGASADGA
jgi:RimJ/RimL family protein N-acetyltransferase